MSLGAWARKLFDNWKQTIGGTFSVTSTNFIELNIKRGQQFEIREKFGPIAIDGGEDFLLVRTGANPVILKRRVVVTDTDKVDFHVSKTPVITGTGTPIFVRNYNDVISNTNEVTVFRTPTFSDAGTFRIFDYLPGQQQTGSRSSGSFSQEGFERILSANTDYLLRVTNNSGTDPLNYYFELSWYEGDILPLGPDQELIP